LNQPTNNGAKVTSPRSSGEKPILPGSPIDGDKPPDIVVLIRFAATGYRARTGPQLAYRQPTTVCNPTRPDQRWKRSFENRCRQAASAKDNDKAVGLQC
jgi:hypothetical protein